MFQIAVEFLKLEKVEYAGIKGRMLSAQTVTIYEEFNEMYKAFQEVTYDPLEPQDTVTTEIQFYFSFFLVKLSVVLSSRYMYVMYIVKLYCKNTPVHSANLTIFHG